MAFTDTERLIGDAAKNQVAMNPNNTVFDAKRLIGRDFTDTTVQRDMKHWPFDVINVGTKPKIQVEFKCEQKTFTPEEVSSMVLTKMKETAEQYLGNFGIFAPKSELKFLSFTLAIFEFSRANRNSNYCVLSQVNFTKTATKLLKKLVKIPNIELNSK